ncbi:MAG: hypothetical protein AB1498_09835 [bacterium]
MRISKTVLGMVVTMFIFAGWQNGSMAEEGAEAAKEVPNVEVSAPAAAPAPEGTISAEPAPTAETPAPAPAETKAEASAAAAPVNMAIADIFAKKAELDGKTVTIHGNVAKVNLGVMGKNWLHIQDGTGAQGANDITITTQSEANINDKITATGIISVDKDFGFGYKYEIIMENASVAKE